MEDGVIQLPPAHRAKAKVKPFIPTAATDPQSAVAQPVHHLAPLKPQLFDPALGAVKKPYLKDFGYDFQTDCR